MNLADAAQLVLTLQLKDEVSAGLKGIQGALDKTNVKGASLSGGLTKIGQGLGVGIKNTAKIGIVGLGALWTQVDAGIESLVELEDVTNQTEAVIKSTGSAAGVTAEDVRRYAQEMEELSGVDDKVIQSGENVLLTFTNIKKDAFEPATLDALNMSEAMDQDLQSSMVQIGKALNDPIKGMTALTRVGVTFTDEQKKVIERMVETGDVAGAQQVILDELNKEFGGSAQASMEGYRGTQLRLKDTWEDLQMTLAEAVLPALDKLGRKLNKFLQDPEVKRRVKDLGDAIAGLFSDENIEAGSDAIKGVFTFLKDLPWDSIKSGMQFAADNAKKVVDVFRSLPPGVQAGLLTFLAANKLTGGLVASGLGELAKVALSSLKTITAANVTVIGANVTGPGLPGGGKGGPGGIPPVVGLGTAVTVVGFGAGVALSVKGDTPLPVSSDQLEQRLREQKASLDSLDSSIDRDLLGFLRSDADTRKLKMDRSQVALDLIKTYTALGPNYYMPEELERLRELAKPAIQAVQDGQRANLIASEIRDRQGLANTKLTTIGQLGADHRDELRRIHTQAQEQKINIQRGNLIASEARERLSSIQASSQRTAQKDFSVTTNTTVHTTFQVGAAKIAAAVEHYKRVSGNKPLDGGQ